MSAVELPEVPSRTLRAVQLLFALACTISAAALPFSWCSLICAFAGGFGLAFWIAMVLDAETPPGLLHGDRSRNRLLEYIRNEHFEQLAQLRDEPERRPTLH